jgi:hypothetical protein
MVSHETHLAITDALRRYCRGVDRLDAAMIASAFHPGAELIDYGPEPTTIEAFAERVIVALGSRFSGTQHRLSNITVEPVSSGIARVESYVLAFHVQERDGGQRLHTFNGRYVDRFEERDGQWRISRRVLRVDWSRVEDIAAPMGGSWVRSGRAGSPDPLDD